VNNTIQYRICDRRIRESGEPICHGNLRGNQGRDPAKAVIEYFQQVTSFRGSERVSHPVIQDEQIEFCQTGKQGWIRAIDVGLRQLAQQTGGAEVTHLVVVSAGRKPKGGSEVSFPAACRAKDQGIQVTGDPDTLGKFKHKAAIETTCGRQVEIFDRGGLGELARRTRCWKRTEEVFSPCAAAALYSRSAFLQVGGFDEDFFSYHEDIDLGFRLRLQGFKSLYVPEAVVYHIGSATLGAQSDFALYHWQRNFIWSFVQNMPSALLWEALPAHLMTNIIYQINYTLRGHGVILLKAKMDAIRGLSRALRKRCKIQKTRKVSRKNLLRILERGPLQPYLLGYHIRKIQRSMKSLEDPF
jgi:hypothetical protein